MAKTKTTKKPAATRTTRSAPRKVTRSVSARDVAPARAELPDLSRALPRPLKPDQSRALLKVGDADLGLAARVARVYGKHASALRIKGIDADDMLEHVAEAEALAPEEARALRLLERLRGARMIAEDAVWRDVLKIAEHLKPLEKDDESLAADFAFLHEHLSARHGRHAAPEKKDPA